MLIVVDGAASARMTPEIQAFQKIRGRASAELCIVHYEAEKNRADPRAWADLCATDSVLHATLDRPESFERLVRLVGEPAGSPTWGFGKPWRRKASSSMCWAAPAWAPTSPR